MADKDLVPGTFTIVSQSGLPAEFLCTHVSVTDLTPLAAEVQRHRADADVEIAKAKAASLKATHSSHAIQESVRTGMTILGIIGITWLGKALQIPDGIIYAAISAIAGLYGVPKAIEKYRARRALPPAK